MTAAGREAAPGRPAPRRRPRPAASATTTRSGLGRSLRQAARAEVAGEGRRGRRLVLQGHGDAPSGQRQPQARADEAGPDRRGRAVPGRASRRSQPGLGIQGADLGTGEGAPPAGLGVAEADRADLGAHEGRTGWPTSASSRRTMCLRPSCRTSSTRALPGRESTIRNESTATGPSSSSTPSRSRRPRSRGDGPGDLGEVGLGDAVPRVLQPVGEVAVVGQQQQALGVGVEAADVEEPLLASPRGSRRCRHGPGRRSST